MLFAETRPCSLPRQHLVAPRKFRAAQSQTEGSRIQTGSHSDSSGEPEMWRNLYATEVCNMISDIWAVLCEKEFNACGQSVTHRPISDAQANQ